MEFFQDDSLNRQLQFNEVNTVSKWAKLDSSTSSTIIDNITDSS